VVGDRRLLPGVGGGSHRRICVAGRLRRGLERGLREAPKRACRLGRPRSHPCRPVSRPSSVRCDRSPHRLAGARLMRRCCNPFADGRGSPSPVTIPWPLRDHPAPLVRSTCRRRDVVAWHGFEGRTGGHRRHSRPFLQARTKTLGAKDCRFRSPVPETRGSSTGGPTCSSNRTTIGSWPDRA
jgi:hypothetical protein